MGDACTTRPPGSLLGNKNALYSWGGVYLLSDQVTLISGLHSRGRIWWVMGFWAPEVPVLPQWPDAVLCCWGVPGASTRIIIHAWRWGRLGEGAGVPVTLFSVMVAVRPQLLCLCISTPVTRAICSVRLQLRSCLLSSWLQTPCSVAWHFCCSFPWGPPLALGEWGEVSFGG